MLHKLQSSVASNLTMKLLAGTLLALLLALVASLVACSSSLTQALTPEEKTVAIAQQTVTTPSAFKVISLTISPPNVNRGEALSIIANVKNASTTEGSYKAGLAVNKILESSKTLTIPAGDTQSVSFTVSRTQAGTYEVSVGDVASIFTVIDQANLAQQSNISNTSSPPNNSSSSCCESSQISNSATPSSGSCCAPPAAPKVSAPAPTPLPPQTRSGGCCGN